MSRITAPGGVATTATERMTAARAVSADLMLRDATWAIIASHWLPAKLMLPAKPQANFPALLVLDTPAGRLAYRLSEAERDSGLLAHLGKVQPNDGRPADDKIGTLQALAEYLAVAS